MAPCAAFPSAPPSFLLRALGVLRRSFVPLCAHEIPLQPGDVNIQKGLFRQTPQHKEAPAVFENFSFPEALWRHVLERCVLLASELRELQRRPWHVLE